MIPARLRKPAAPALAALALTLLLVPCSSAGAAPRHPLPLAQTHRSQYTAVPVCAVPRPGHGACQSRRVVRRGGALRAFAVPHAVPAGAPAPEAIGYTPQDMHAAYSLPPTAESAQTIAIVDAYNDPTAEADLEAFDKQFGLPACTAEEGCFVQTNQNGETGEESLPFPKDTEELEQALKSPEEARREQAAEAEGWGLEISLDIETAHAICQNCKIALVEAEGSSFESLAAAEEAAATTLKATEISNSWGGSECGFFPSFQCVGPAGAAPFEHPGTVVTASAGDGGYLNAQEEGEPYANYPASLPHVVAVGGTFLEIERSTPVKYLGETVWNGSGGGCSDEYTSPSWQQAAVGWSEVGCGSGRAVSDVAADADPASGEAVYYSRPECFTEYEVGKRVPNWCQIGGTSLASPLIASVYALAGGAHGVRYPAATLYENLLFTPAGLHDVTTGSNGECEGSYICVARAGYDGPTGVGTPNGLSAFSPGKAPPPPPEEKRPPEETHAPPSSAPNNPPAPTTTPATVLSRLNLTFEALRALARRRPTLAAVAFSFAMSRSATVRVSLARRVRSHRRVRWVAVGRPFTINAAGGSNGGRLRGRGRLLPGAYRLTLTPSGGAARSIRFTLG